MRFGAGEFRCKMVIFGQIVVVFVVQTKFDFAHQAA